MQAARMQAVQRPFTAMRPAAASRARLVVVAVKPTKAADFRSLSNDEIESKVLSLKRELASVRFLQHTRGISEVKPGEQNNPDPEKVPKAHMNKHLRRQIAQLATIVRERQIKEGINRKQAKQMEKRALLASGGFIL